jgi:hemoglobin
MELKTEKSLYERLGGYNAIAAVIDDFTGRMGSDKQLGRFYLGFCTNSKRKMRQLIVDMMCEATGGPAFYMGRDMKTVHTGINITESDWQAGVKLLTATLEKFKVPQRMYSLPYLALNRISLEDNFQ